MIKNQEPYLDKKDGNKSIDIIKFKFAKYIINILKL